MGIFRNTFRAGILSGAALLAVAQAGVIPGDAHRGAEVFESQKCGACHSLQGQGGKAAPDLAKSIGRAWTPGLLASLMWNHAPAMWPQMEKAGIEKPQLTDQQAADLYAYLYAFRFFEKPGDAARGKRVFEGKGCAGCHALAAGAQSTGPAVANWSGLSDSIALARAMWNHSAGMNRAMAEKQVSRPTLTSQEMTDLVVYLRNIPQSKQEEQSFAPSDPQQGAELFKSKGCIQCHQGSLAMQNRFTGRTLTDLATAMWNHSDKMRQPTPELSLPEMKSIVAYLWSQQYFEQPGNPDRGEKVFAAKQCASCHNDPASGAPSLAGRDLNSISMVSVLWRHGPQMLERMRARNIPWPQFRGSELTDLIAYVNSLK